MLILGLDPGSHKFGWAILREDRRRFTVEASGVIKPKYRVCLEVYTSVRNTFIKHRPELIAVEMPFIHPKHRADTVIPLAQVRGAAIVAVEECGGTVIDLSACEVKRLTTGKGNADKEQVAKWVAFQTGFTTSRPDESDAIAVAIAGYYSQEKRLLQLRG